MEVKKMKNEILPIGSIITVGDTDLMICAYFKKDAEYNGKKYDYACCQYPNGLGKEAALVKKEDIIRVKFIGFQDGKFVEFKHQFLGDKNE